MTSLADFKRIILRLERDGLHLGLRTVMGRLVNHASDKFSLAELDLPLRPEDIADSLSLHPLRPGTTGERRLRIGWVCTPPGAGSGGHTTLFRMVRGLEERGHECTLFLYDRNDDDVSRHEGTIRRGWPELRADVRSATGGFAGMDGLVASSWSSAHVVASRLAHAAHCFYFIQDFEPYFYPRGTLYALAEDSYKFGFRNMALGNMVAAIMNGECGVRPELTVDFGCDTRTYRQLEPPLNPAGRTGIVFYAKRSVDRRGYLLAKMALEKFHLAHPEQEIHAFGDVVTGWRIPVVNHGNLSPTELNALYNRTIAGLVISFTNISLVPDELMAAGNVPVLNSSEFSSAVVSAEDAVWAPPTPDGMASALSRVVQHTDVAARAEAVAGRFRPDWQQTQEQVSSFIEQTCFDFNRVSDNERR